MVAKNHNNSKPTLFLVPSIFYLGNISQHYWGSVRGIPNPHSLHLLVSGFGSGLGVHKITEKMGGGGGGNAAVSL